MGCDILKICNFNTKSMKEFFLLREVSEPVNQIEVDNKCGKALLRDEERTASSIDHLHLFAAVKTVPSIPQYE